MPINLRAPEVTELKPRITVLGIGGAGGNAVNNMINAKLEGVSFVVANTDAQALAQSRADRRIQLGARVTEGLGAGAKPDVGRAAAEESLDEILEHLSGAHMVFITAGMGGGTGTGAAPVVARAVRELGILTVGVVTKPFQFEGERRMHVAERGIEELQNFVDTLIVIPNQNLFRVANERTTFAQAFAMADDVLHSGVRGVTDLIVMPGLINRDFADIKTVMSEMGKAMMGTGEMDGENRALRAAEAAISNPLLDDVSMKGARAVLVNVTGGTDLMLFEVDEAVNRIRAEVDPDANILFGSAVNENMEGRVRVSVVATGIDAEAFPENMPDNVARLHTMRSKETRNRPGLDVPEIRARADAPEASPVHRQMEALTQGMATRDVEEALRDSVPAAMRERAPFELGGDQAPEIDGEEDGGMAAGKPAIAPEPRAPVPADQSLAAPRPLAPEREKRRGGLIGIFGGRKREGRTAPRYEMPPPEPRRSATEARPAMAPETKSRSPSDERVYQPAVSAARAPARPGPGAEPTRSVAQPAVAQTSVRTVTRTTAPPAAASSGEPALTPSSEDLFSGVTEDDRFEIPAFLRRQANSGH